MMERLPVSSNNETTRAAKELMQEALISCIEDDPPNWVRDAAEPPAVAEPWIEDLLSKPDTYRAGALTIFCYAAASPGMDLRDFSEGVRGTGELTKKLLPYLSIPATRGNPFETIAKGSSSYVGRARESWNKLLEWASTEATSEEVRAVTAKFVRTFAALRRAVPPMPSLDTERLTWAAVVDILEALTASGSQGTYEQLIVAALVEASHMEAVEQRRLYVTTKPVTASDASSGTAGDIQVREPSGAVRNAIEVADTNWAGKIAQTVAAMKREDLSGFLVLASAEGFPSRAEIEAAIASTNNHPEQRDIAVLDLRSEIRSMVARLDRVSRRRMLMTLYRYLLDYQPDDSRVIQFVKLLAMKGLII